MANQQMRRTSGFAVASLVCGICGVVIPCLGFLPALLGIIFGTMAMGQIGSNPNLSGRGKAIAGLACGIVGTVIWLGILITVIWWIWSHYQRYY